MKNLKFLLIQTMLMLWISIPSLAQQHTIKVWPEVVPGAIDAPGYTEKTEYVAENTSRIFQVTDPELAVYPAPADIATGTGWFLLII